MFQYSYRIGAALGGIFSALALIGFFFFFSSMPNEIKKAPLNKDGLAVATFSGGCFWCVESDLEKLDGVKEVISGYAGGKTPNPTYQNHADHREAVQVFYDPEETSYQDLLNKFWKSIDPTDEGGQFYDRGHSYTTAIFYHDTEQKALATKSKQALEQSKRFDYPIVTPVIPYTNFTDAEDYHQDYYLKNPTRYKFYRTGSGRDRFIDKYWNK